MQTRDEQLLANRARIGAYYRRHTAWVKEYPGQARERLRELSHRYRHGLHLRRFWRTLWATPAPGSVRLLSTQMRY